MNIDFETKNVWKYITMSLLVASLTGIPSYIVLMVNTTNADEVKTLIAEHSPYNQDRKIITSTLENHDEAIISIMEKLESMNRMQGEIVGKLDILLSRRESE